VSVLRYRDREDGQHEVGVRGYRGRSDGQSDGQYIFGRPRGR